MKALEWLLQSTTSPWVRVALALRATGTTALFDAGVPEAIIQKRTGHKSISALRQYERVTASQNEIVASVLLPRSQVGEESIVYNTLEPMITNAPIFTAPISNYNTVTNTIVTIPSTLI